MESKCRASGLSSRTLHSQWVCSHTQPGLEAPPIDIAQSALNWQLADESRVNVSSVCHSAVSTISISSISKNRGELGGMRGGLPRVP